MLENYKFVKFSFRQNFLSYGIYIYIVHVVRTNICTYIIHPFVEYFAVTSTGCIFHVIFSGLQQKQEDTSNVPTPTNRGKFSFVLLHAAFTKL